MLRRLLLSLTVFLWLNSSGVQARTTPTSVVPFVGCPSDGMGGPAKAPTGKPKRLPISAEAAARLAYYSVGPNLSVLAPRGWHCHNIYGSSGNNLVISPNPIDADSIYDAFSGKGFTGPVVELDWNLGFTSGREQVAAVVRHAFPAHKDYLQQIADEMDDQPMTFAGPFPSDKIRTISNERAEYTTASEQRGLGTLNTALAPGEATINGVEMLVKDRGDCCDLFSLSVRLSPEDADLAPVIKHEVERETHDH